MPKHSSPSSTTGAALDKIRTKLGGQRPEILVVGDLMLDRYVSGDCERISPEAPVQVVDVSEEHVTLGGAGNVVANVISLGVRASVAGVVGDGHKRPVLMGLVKELGANSGHVIAEVGRRVTEKTRIVAAGQQVVRFDVEDRRAISEASEDALISGLSDAIGGVDVVVLSDYGKGVLTPRVCRAIVDGAREVGVPVLCDPKGSDWSKYEGAFAATPNRKEAAAMAGIDSIDEGVLPRMGELLRQRYSFDHVLITLGDKGMFASDGNHGEFIPTVAREVFDVTGAGDTVIAALAVALACDVDFAPASRFANAAAGIAVGKLGTSAISLDEVQRFVMERGPRAHEKIKTRGAIEQVCAELRNSGKRLVFTNGCFDALHVGHITLLEEASSLGDVLIVGLNTDSSARRLKPGRPVNSQGDRARMLSAVESVDYVVLFDEDTPYELVRSLRPDVIVKGGDYEPDQIVGADLVLEHGGEVHVVPLVDGYSTTGTIEHMLERTD